MLFFSTKETEMSKPRCAAYLILCCLMFVACRQSAKDLPAEANPPVTETRTDSWIGVELAVQAAPENEIRGENDYAVLIAGVLPTAPADGVLKKDDILTKVDGKPVTDIVKAIDVIRGWPAGQKLEVAVRRGNKVETLTLRPEPKPTPTALLNRAYVGRPLSPFGGVLISIAEADGQGGIVPGSQCVMEYDTTCPKFGRLGQTNLAVGKATVLLFWTQIGAVEGKPEQSATAFATLKGWRERFGAQGLEIVAVTRDSPRTLAPYLKKVGPQPRMTLISMFLGNYGSARLAESYAPCVLILDEKGVVRAVAGTVEDMTEISDRVLPELLRTPQQ